MELRQITYFEAVARCGGFGRAADELLIAQPAISSQIKNLEREVGARLFDRTTRRVSLTEAGERLLPRAIAILAEVSQARAELEQLGQVVRGRLRIAVTPVLGTLDLAALLAGYHRRQPEVDVRIRSGNVGQSLDSLDRSEVDVVLAPLHARLPKRFVAHALAQERVVVICPPGRLPARPRRIDLARLREDVFICLSEETGLHSILTAAARAQGFTPKIRFRVPDPQTIRRFVANDLGVALLAESVAQGEGPAVDVREPVTPIHHPPIGLIYRAGTTPGPAVRAWLEHLTASVH